MMQTTLDGSMVGYTCKFCPHVSATMQESSRHFATKHRIKTKTKTTISFALENYCLISTKAVLVHV